MTTFDQHTEKLASICSSINAENPVLRHETANELVTLYNLLVVLKGAIKHAVKLSRTLGGKLFEIRSRQSEFIDQFFSPLSEIPLDNPEKCYQMLIQLSSMQALLVNEHPLLENKGLTDKKKEVTDKLNTFLKVLDSIFDSFDIHQTNTNITQFTQVLDFLHLCQNAPHRESICVHEDIAKHYSAYLKKLTQWVSTIEATLVDSFAGLSDVSSEASPQQATERFVEALLALNTALNSICVQSEFPQVQTLLNRYLKGQLQTFIRRIIVQLEHAEMICAVYQWRSIAQALSPLDCLSEKEAGLQSVATLLKALSDRALALENSQVVALRECVSHGKYASFVADYESLNALETTDKDTITEALNEISVQALQKIEEALAFASKYQSADFNTLSKEDLAHYFLVLSELENYRVVFAFLKNPQHAEVESKINTITKAYAAQVVKFSAHIHKVSNPDVLAKVASAVGGFFSSNTKTKKINVDFMELYRCFVNESQALLQFSSVPTIHQILSQSIVENEQRFVLQLREACEQYKTMLVKDYSNDLRSLFNFLASIQPQFSVIYNEFTQLLRSCILGLIQHANPGNYGYDVHENCMLVMTQKKPFIPDVIFQACEKRINQERAKAEAIITIELGGLSKLTIRELMDRLLNTTHMHYATLVHNRLNDCIARVIEETTPLLENHQFYEAIQFLAQEWSALSYCAQNFPTCFNKFSETDLNNELKALSNNLFEFSTETLSKIKDPIQEIFTISDSLSREQKTFTFIQASLNQIKTLISLCATTYGQDSLLSAILPDPKKAITCLQNIVTFYAHFLENFSKFVRENRFNDVLHLMRLIRDNIDTSNQFLALIYQTEYHDALKKAGIQFDRIPKQLNYGDIKKRVNAQFAQLSADASLSAKNDRRFNSAIIDEQKEFHRTVFQAFEGLKHYQTSSIYQEFSDLHQTQESIEQVLAQVKKVIQENLTFIVEPATEVLDSAEFPGFNEAHYRLLDKACQNLCIAAEVCHDQDILVIIHGDMDFFRQTVVKKLHLFIENILESNDMPLDELMHCLFKLKIMSQNTSEFKKNATDALEKLLKHIQKHHFSQCSISTLSSKLEEEQPYQAIAQEILNGHDVFKSFVINLRNDTTLFHGVDYVCEKLEKDALNVERLKQLYENFRHTYWDQIERGLAVESESTVDTRVAAIYGIVSDNSISYEIKIVQLAASLFAHWSIEEHKTRAESVTEWTDDIRATILQPHPAQVISIFRLFGADREGITHDETQTMQKQAQAYLQKHLIEIPTGEGKSITLGVTAMLFALMGFDVDCACYSHYLSQRDYDDFCDMFHAFKLNQHIFYGTFKDLSERWINEQHGNVRDAVDSLMRQTGKAGNVTQQNTSRPRVLLLDEVDVFFGKDFCGSTYKLSHMFSHPDVHALIHYIWTQSKDNIRLLSLERIKNNPESGYEKLLTTLIRGSQSLLDHAITAMIEDVKIYRTQQGSFILDPLTQKIGYQGNSHVIEYNIAYRYQTMFAYIDYLELKKITARVLQGKVGLLLECGEFSYAEMPKQYAHIFGVTATLTTLNVTQKNLLDTILSVQAFTYLPSVYGESKLKFPIESAVKVVKNADHFQAITDEINRCRISNDSQQLRPVIVFFKSLDELKAYYKQITRLGIDSAMVSVLDETLGEDERNNIITRATHAGKITLATAPYGRGTNFRCYDKLVDSHGGPHAIQTFFPSDISEETQFKGRPARQGGNGSYSMVLNATDLEEEYGTDNTAFLRDTYFAQVDSSGGATPSLYEQLHQLRELKLQQQYEQRSQELQQIQLRHTKSIAFIRALNNPQGRYSSAEDNRQLLTTLCGLNQFETVIDPSIPIRRQEKTASGETYRTICLIDATSSMRDILDAVKDTVQAMFTRAQEVLEESSLIAIPTIEMQFVFYRNYNADRGRLLEHSDWMKGNDIQMLESFLSNISAQAGWGNEAAEVAFAYVNQLVHQGTQIQQIIWIGDMPPNTCEQVSYKRNHVDVVNCHGQEFKEPVYFFRELMKIHEAKIPVHAFWVPGQYFSESKREIESCYKRVAIQTGGQSGSLDICGQEGAEALAHCVTECIVENAGGELGQELVQEYRVKYRPTHVGSSISQKTATPTVVRQPTLVPDSLFISKDSALLELDKYLKQVEGSFSSLFHHSGIKDAKRLKSDIERNVLDETKISERFNQWANGKGSKSRKDYASAYVIYRG